MRRDVPTCSLTDRIGDIRQDTRELGWDICAVVTEERIVLGLLYGNAWEADPDTPVEDVMSNGPPTTRPSTFLDDMVGRLQKRDLPGILVSSSNGALMGYLWRTDGEAVMATGNCTHTCADRPCSPSEI
jgi:CBS domain-containing protein